MQKSALQYGEIIFQSKVIPLFLPKCSKLHHSEMYTVENRLSLLLLFTVVVLAYLSYFFYYILLYFIT